MGHGLEDPDLLPSRSSVEQEMRVGQRRVTIFRACDHEERTPDGGDGLRGLESVGRETQDGSHLHEEKRSLDPGQSAEAHSDPVVHCGVQGRIDGFEDETLDG